MKIRKAIGEESEMEFVGITEETQNAFFSCLSCLQEVDWKIEDSGRYKWYTEYKEKGYRARVLRLDSGEIVGKCHYIPIEHSPLVGRDLMVILCLCVHMYKRHIGDQRGKGYGRYILGKVEEDALASGFKGVATWAMDWDWNPVSFYEHMGYSRTDKEDKVVVVWKPFRPDAEPPKLMRLDSIPCKDTERVNVLVADNQWCNGNQKLSRAREAIQGIEQYVNYKEVGAPYCDRIIHLGYVGGVFLDGKPYRAYQMIGDSKDLRAEIIRLYEQKKQTP